MALEQSQSISKKNTNSSNLIYGGSLRLLRGLLFFLGPLLISSGLIVNHLYKEVFLPPIFYLSASGVLIFLGLFSFFIPHFRKNLSDYAFITFSLLYLAIIYFAYANLLGTYFVTLLITGQILLCISFKNLAEYLLIATVTMGLFGFSSFHIKGLETNPILFTIIMSLATILSGFYIWFRNNSAKSRLITSDLDNLIYDPNSPEEVSMAMALKQSEEDYREIFNAGTEGIIIIHPEKKTVLESNQKTLELIGYNTKDLVDLDFDQLLKNEGISLNKLIERALKGVSPTEEVEFIKKSGEQIPLSLTAKLILLGGHFRIVLLLNNIEERRDFIQKLNLFADLFESVDVGMVILKLDDPENDQSLRIVSANAYASNALRMRADGLAGKYIDEVFPGLRATNGLAQITLSIKSNQILRIDDLQFHEMGVVNKSWQTKIVPLSENLAGVLFEDDTERRQNIDRLKLFKELVNQSSDAIFVVDPEDGSVIDFNQQFSNALGYQPKESQSLKVKDLIKSTNFKIFKGKSLEDIKSFGSSLYQEKIQRKDGSFLPVEVNLGFVQIYKKEYIVGVARDITERIHQESALKESEQKYRTLVEKMNEGLALTDNDETILFINDRLCEILRKSKDELIGKKSYEIFVTDGSKEIIEEKFELRRKGISDQYELKLQHRNGDIVWVMIAGAPFIDGNADMVGTIAIITDITDRKTAEIKLRDKNNELDSFVYKASHDLKGPLASIIGITNIAKEEINDPESIRYFNLISKSTGRLDLILTELIDLTRINKAKLKFEEVKIGQLVDDIITGLKHQPQSQNVHFIKEINLPNGFVSDQKLLNSIFQNLILNSIIYRNPEADPSFVKFIAKEWEDKVLFTIEDNGLGISEKIQARVFEMFYRGNAKSKGSGLGLYLVKNSVEKLHGNIDLESTINIGTKISISLPQNLYSGGDE